MLNPPKRGCLKSFLRASFRLLSEKSSDHSVELLLRPPVLGEIQPPSTGEVQPTRLTCRLGIAPRAPWLGTVSSPARKDIRHVPGDLQSCFRFAHDGIYTTLGLS